ncbi:MAG: hypothetical protein QXZ62_08470 [Candidatus Caldarchaeum sp.]
MWCFWLGGVWMGFSRLQTCFLPTWEIIKLSVLSLSICMPFLVHESLNARVLLL